MSFPENYLAFPASHQHVTYGNQGTAQMALAPGFYPNPLANSTSLPPQLPVATAVFLRTDYSQQVPHSLTVPLLPHTFSHFSAAQSYSETHAIQLNSIGGVFHGNFPNPLGGLPSLPPPPRETTADFLRRASLQRSQQYHPNASTTQSNITAPHSHPNVSTTQSRVTLPHDHPREVVASESVTPLPLIRHLLSEQFVGPKRRYSEEFPEQTSHLQADLDTDEPSLKSQTIEDRSAAGGKPPLPVKTVTNWTGQLLIDFTKLFKERLNRSKRSTCIYLELVKTYPGLTKQCVRRHVNYLKTEIGKKGWNWKDHLEQVVGLLDNMCKKAKSGAKSTKERIDWQLIESDFAEVLREKSKESNACIVDAVCERLSRKYDVSKLSGLSKRVLYRIQKLREPEKK